MTRMERFGLGYALALPVAVVAHLLWGLIT